MKQSRRTISKDPVCWVFGCGSTDPPLYYPTLYRDIKKWVQLIGRENCATKMSKAAIRSKGVCFRHFPTCSRLGRKFLKKEAYPELNLPGSEQSDTIQPAPIMSPPIESQQKLPQEAPIESLSFEPQQIAPRTPLYFAPQQFNETSEQHIPQYNMMNNQEQQQFNPNFDLSNAQAVANDIYRLTMYPSYIPTQNVNTDEFVPYLNTGESSFNQELEQAVQEPESAIPSQQQDPQDSLDRIINEIIDAEIENERNKFSFLRALETLPYE